MYIYICFYIVSLYIHTFSLLTIVCMAQAKQVSSCCILLAGFPVKQVISRKLTVFLRRYVCPLGFFHRGHRGEFL